MQRNVAQFRPEVLVLEASLAPDPNTLRNYLATLAGTIAIVVLPHYARLGGQQGPV